VAYRDAGAEVLYAPGIRPDADIARVVAEVGAPMNFLAPTSEPSVAELAALGVRRISAGSLLFNEAYGTLREVATEMILPGA
jgi:2-methylisocitrate lyase-like PEP mutase family enzyme